MMTLIAEAALRSLLLGALVWLAMIAIRPRNPHLQKTVWLTVLLASIAMPIALLSSVTPSIEAPEYLLSITGTADSAGTANDSPFGGSPLLISTATAAYAIVTIGFIVRFAAGFLRLSRIRREAKPLAHASGSKLDVRVTRRLLSPATFGSTILLPEEMNEWSADKLAAVLSHERAHVLNRDCYVLWIARLHACVFWFNPLAWWLHRRLADLAETTSDDAVIATLADRTGYADILLEIARNPTRELVVTSAARANISARIERIVSNIPPATPPRRWVRALAIAVLIPPFAIAAATLQGGPVQPAPGPIQPALAPMQPALDPGKPVLARPGASMPTPTPAEPDPLKPQVIDRSGAGLEQHYPTEAKRFGRESLVVVEVDIDAQGNPVDARVAEMDPADEKWGFGPSAVEVARKARFSNPAGKPSRVRMRVKFELRH
jgi:TonB family protein